MTVVLGLATKRRALGERPRPRRYLVFCTIKFLKNEKKLSCTHERGPFLYNQKHESLHETRRLFVCVPLMCGMPLIFIQSAWKDGHTQGWNKAAACRLQATSIIDTNWGPPRAQQNPTTNTTTYLFVGIVRHPSPPPARLTPTTPLGRAYKNPSFHHHYQSFINLTPTNQQWVGNLQKSNRKS